jgi:predicted Mrr-cat superfamily restriction endonuclease
MRRLWLVRLGNREAHALDTGELVFGICVVDLRAAKDRRAVLALVKQALPDSNYGVQLNVAAQLNRFSNTIEQGDLAVVPLKTTGKIAIGEIAGPCAPTAEGHPMRCSGPQL